MTRSYYCPRCGWRLEADPDTLFALNCEECETRLEEDKLPTLRRLGENPFFLPKEKLTPLDGNPRYGTSPLAKFWPVWNFYQHWKTDAAAK